MYQNYVFDLYGTLADIHTDEDNPTLWGKTAEMYSKNGAQYTGDELRSLYLELVEEQNRIVIKNHPEFTNIDIKIEKVFRKLYELKGVSPDESLVAATASYFRSVSREYIRLYDGIKDLLTELKKHGKVYLLTNAQRSFTWEELEILGIRDIFDAIVISSDEECCKPDKHFYQAIIDRYDLDPKQTIMVGNDPVTDVQGAMSVGFDTLYIHTNISPQINTNTGCTYFIPDGDTRKMKDYLI